LKRRLLLSAALMWAAFTEAAPASRVSFYVAYSQKSLSACGATMRGSWRQIAVSRDLRRRYPCGSRVRVTLKTPKGGVRSFIATVNDTTHRRWRSTVDILITSADEAMSYGVTSGTITLLHK
jgi:3D (Asp-Asp-Asp) domain-containing protein